MREGAVSKSVFCPCSLAPQNPSLGTYENQDVSTLLGITATRERTCTAPLYLRVSARAPQGCMTEEHSKSLDLGDDGEWGRRASHHSALPTPPKPIKRAGMSEFGYKEYILLPTSCPKAGLADGHMFGVEEAAARRQLSACPVLRASILDFTLTLHSLKMIYLNALLIKQLS